MSQEAIQKMRQDTPVMIEAFASVREQWGNIDA